jgi:hypothetical protein
MPQCIAATRAMKEWRSPELLLLLLLLLLSSTSPSLCMPSFFASSLCKLTLHSSWDVT